MERDLFFWILIGLVTGTVARLVFPAREPGGFVLSLLLGIAGALAGGFALVAFGGGSMDRSLAAAIAGAMVFLVACRIVLRARIR